MAGARSDEAASETVESVHFSFYSPEEVRKISVKKITRPDLLDVKSTPVPDGLYDPALGPLNDTDPCKSCGQLSVRCPGHCGHIDLAKPLYNPLLFRSLQNILQITCFYCHKFRLNEEKVQRYASELDLIIRGDIVEARNLETRSWSELFFPEEDAVKYAADHIGETCPDATGSKKQTWTSLQYTEALSILSKLTRNKPKKCSNCGSRNPKITSPTFGWLNKDTLASDIRSNLIIESNLDLSSSEAQNAEVQQSEGDTLSHMDEEPLPTQKTNEAKNQLKSLPPEYIKKMLSSGQKHLLPAEAETVLRGLWENEAKLCMLICDIQQKGLSLCQRKKGYMMFFLKTLLVPPNKFRPPAGSSTRGVLEHPQNVLLSKVQESNIALRNAIGLDPNHPDILRRWMDLQNSVNVLFDSSKGFVKSEREVNGYRQLLEKKDGILRQKMMGKRVNFACRSVISPDPYLRVDEIGIPPCFALKLTYPERVTPWNAKELRQAVINGADIHPGATHYKDKESMYKLQAGTNRRYATSKKLLASRGIVTQQGKGPESESEDKFIIRHLRNGDTVVANRQPSLHKPSMMAHRVYVLKEDKTIRLHYANCSTYNADFDGDEMNVHFPQDEVSRAEAAIIVDANKQYIVPTSGNPIRGLIQDHIISAVLLTKLDTFLTHDEYHQLLYSCLPASCRNSQVARLEKKVSVIHSSDEIHPLPPAILKPIPLWTGKQVITAILNYITKGRPPFTAECKGRIPREYLQNNHPEGKNSKDEGREDLSELILCIYDNELIKGIIDKNQFGKYGIVHTVHELYGADAAGILMSMFSRLFTLFLQMHGFTCGVDDLLLIENLDTQRRRILQKSEIYSEEVHMRFTGTMESDSDPVKLQREVEKVIRRNGEAATISLDRMMSSTLNNVTSEVNKFLFPRGLRKPFPENCLSLMTTTGAKGGLVNMTQISSLLGQQELEGKRVPRMVSGKTLPCFPPWDISARAGGFIGDRFLSGLRPQEYYFHCMAGRDGLVDTAIKTSRSGYLQRCLIKNLECLKVSYDQTVRDVDGSVVQFMYGEDGVDVLKCSFLSEFKALADNRAVVLDKISGHLVDGHLSDATGYIKELPSVLREKATSFARLPKEQQRCRHDIKRKDIIKLLNVKYLLSLAGPGEPVGVIAAQSVGEPSTQMTLNTFHFAGRGDMNVTLGIPRLQEILMTASEDIRTPVMKCRVLDRVTREDAESVAAKLRRICVADVVESMEVCTVPFSIRGNQVSTIYKLKMKLYRSELYPSYSDLSLEDCQRTLRTAFVDAMEEAIQKHLDMIKKISDISVVISKDDSSLSNEVDEEEHIGRSGGEEKDDGVTGGGDDDETDDEQGTDSEKRKRQASDEMEYEDGLEKDNTTIVEEHDGETQTGFESEIDQLEADEDYTVGGEVPNEIEAETPDSPSKSGHTSMSELGNKDRKSVEKDKKRKSESKKTTTKPKRSSKKPERTIFVEAKDLNFEVHYIFTTGTRILLAEIAQKTAKRVNIKESTNIERCSVVEEKKGESLTVQTAGVNFQTFWDLEDYLDVNRIVSNDIHAMLNTYGVEAARATIIQEVKGVFEAYGILVNIRHLNLIADFMTFHGGYRPMNRVGMGEYNTSPFGKMTFETATKFIIGSAFHGEVDTLQSPSASVCLGQPVKMGTGSFDLMQNLQLQ
ncbi:DNA-directed RNA polymerase I subunit 1 isoform X1 [Typha angustifolia]|uniref:DNA-directed RNA polymerase I subunit 1 isoform X1 n=2 Tax=Typha angustifolia TaxID=59011 RepID=UPI003C30CF96